MSARVVLKDGYKITSSHPWPALLWTSHISSNYTTTGVCDTSSVGKESGDPVLIPGLGRFSEEGMGYPLQCSWISLMSQLVKNPPAMQ